MPCASWSCYCRQEIPPSSDRSLSLQHSWKALDGFPSSNHCASSELLPSLSPSVIHVLFPTRRIKKRTLPTKLSQRCPVKISEGTWRCYRSRPLPSFEIQSFHERLGEDSVRVCVCVCRVGEGVSNGSVRFELYQLNATCFHVKHSLSTLNIHRLMRYRNIDVSTPIIYICGHPVVDVTEIGSREILKRRNILAR